MGDQQGPVVREQSTYMTDQQAEQLCQVFSEGLGSGIGYSRIFGMLERNGLDQKLVDRLREAVLEKGDQLGEAFARYGVLDPTARKLALVAEQQGQLPETFAQLAEIYGLRHKRKKDFIYSMVEPMILFALGIILGNLLSSNLAEITMSEQTWSLLMGVFIQAGIQVAFFGLTAFSVFFSWLNLPVDFAPRDYFSRLWLRFPVISEPKRLFSIALFCRYLKQSISSGIDIYRSLELASEASNNMKLLREVDASREKLKRGSSLAEALFEAKMIPDDVIENIEIGEESGRLEERLDFLAERYDERATDRFERQMAAIVWILRYGIVVFVIGAMMLQVATMEFL
jgi:type II secretory pathway component PulF